MISTIQSTRTEKPVQTGRRTFSKPKHTKPLTKGQRLVAALEALSVKRPPDFDWKEDYIQALEEKYAGIR